VTSVRTYLQIPETLRPCGPASDIGSYEVQDAECIPSLSTSPVASTSALLPSASKSLTESPAPSNQQSPSESSTASPKASVETIPKRKSHNNKPPHRSKSPLPSLTDDFSGDLKLFLQLPVAVIFALVIVLTTVF